MNAPTCSRPSSCFYSSSRRPAKHGTKVFLGGTVLLLSLFIPGSWAFAQTTADARGGPLTFSDNAANSPRTASLVGVRRGTLNLLYRALGNPSAVALSGAGKTDGLVSIVVSPLNPSIAFGETQQFTAAGHFGSRSTQNLTASVVWSSSAPDVATINAAGLASSVSPGSTTITATWAPINPLSLATGVTPGTPIINWPPTTTVRSLHFAMIVIFYRT